jgi:hypothetical protein
MCKSCFETEKKNFEFNAIACSVCRNIMSVNNNIVQCIPHSSNMAKRIMPPPTEEDLRNMGIHDAEINYNLGQNAQQNRIGRWRVREFARMQVMQFRNQSRFRQLIAVTKIAIFFSISYFIGHSILRCKRYISKLFKKISKYYRAPVQHRKLKGIQSLF